MGKTLEELMSAGGKPVNIGGQTRGRTLESLTGTKATTPKPQSKKQGILSRAASIADVVIGKPAEFLFGTSAGAVSSMVGESIESLRGKPGVFTEEAQKRFGTPLSATGTIVGTALELLPGGTITKGFKGVKPVQNFAKGLKGKAITQFTEALAPTTRKMKAQAERVVPELIQKGITGKPEEIAKIARSTAEEIGQRIDDMVAKLPKNKKASTAPIVEAMEGLKKKYMVDGVAANKTAIDQIDGLIGTIDELGGEAKQIPLSSMRKLRQIWDEHFDISKGLDDIAAYKKKAERIGADEIRKIFAKEAPDIAELNRQYSLWAGARDVAEWTALRQTGQMGFGKKILARTLGAGAGAAAGVPGLVVGEAIGRIMSSPGWKTFSAVSKDKLANALMQNDIGTLQSVLRQMSRAAGVGIIDEITEE